MTRHLIIALFCTLGLVTSLVRADRVVRGENSVVIAGHPEAVRLGLDTLRRGGNAVDALVTVSFALGVAEPGNSGPGGKLVLMYYDAHTKKVTCMVALGAAPKELDIEKMKGLPIDQRKRGWQAVCMPGLVAGLDAAHEKWGRLRWSELVEPAAQLADHGFVVSELAANMMAEFPKGIDAEAGRIYMAKGGLPKAGDVLRNEEMAATLRTIAKGGAKAFYQGDIAEKVVQAARSAGSTLSLDDFKSYRPRFLDPVEGDFNGFNVYSSPPPLSGGTTVVMALKCLQGWNWQTAQPRDASYIDSACRVMEQVYPIVSNAAADVPDSADRVKKAMSKANIDRMRKRAQEANVADPYPDGQARVDREQTLDDLDEASTTHLIIADREGNVVCATQSLGYHFGAGVVAPGTGFLLNNDMNNFAYQTAGSVNLVGPGKWPRSTMAPTIILKDGRPVLAIGSPAGQRIPVMILQVVLDVMKFGRDLEQAVPAPRFHLRRVTGGKPNEIDLETGSPPGLSQALQKLGWATYPKANAGDFYFGAVNAVRFLPDGSKVGVADQRRTNDAGGD